MRTKTLLLTAALVAAGISASQAQVYSVNAVGYVNVSLLAGKFYMLANPLNATNNNHINAVLGNVPTDTALFSWTGTAFAAAEQFIDPVNGWFDGGGNPSTTTLPPGVGFFITSPVDTTITFVGDVAQGNLSNPIPAGYSIRASQVPQSAGLNALGFPGLVDDIVYFYNPIAGNYTTYTAVDSGPPTLWFDEGGNPVDPTPAVAQGFFVSKGAAASWTRTFTVN